MRRPAAPRGYVLLFVLMILLVLSLVVASLYAQSEELRASNLTASFQQIAAVNADRGVQAAIQAVRNGTLSVPSGTCTPGEAYRTDCPGLGAGYAEYGVPTSDGGIFIEPGSACSGAGCTPTEGSGLQYSYFVYRSAAPSNPLNRYTIRATGYAGMSEQALNLVTSVVEVEIELGSLKFQCTNSYECNGG
jgi:hypothetical protein